VTDENAGTRESGTDLGGHYAGGQPSILDLLNLEYIEQNLYRSCVVFDAQRPRLYGGQVAAQALYAAGQTVSAGRQPHSLHGYFLREGSPLRPTVFQVERDRDGYSFSARRVVAIQNGEVIFNMAASFAEPRSGADVDAEPVPQIPAPQTVPVWKRRRGHESFEFRTAQTEQDGYRAPIKFWIRCTANLVDDPLLHAAILTYTSDISSGLIAFERDGTLSGPSLDHAVWFHRPARMDEWTWQDLTPQTAAAGRGLYTGAVYSESGARLATIAQETLFREPRKP
jgi:acyl-CoA thioesterase II